MTADQLATYLAVGGAGFCLGAIFIYLIVRWIS
jgi:hypothetical protein